MFDQQSLRSACAYAQSDQSLCLSLEYSMSVKLQTENHLKFLSLKGRFIGSSVCTCQNATLLEIMARIIIFTPDPAVDNFPVPFDPVAGDPKPNLQINNQVS